MEDSDSVTGKPATRLGSSRRLLGKITPRLKVASGIVASVAAIGAVASGLVGYWQVWKTVRSDFLQTHVSPPHIGSHPTASPRPTVVVLPFINSTGDVSRDGVASNISQELSIALEKFGAQRLLDSGVAIASAPLSALEVARKIGADYAVEGAVQDAAGNLRVFVRLHDARTGEQVWSDSFERAKGDFNSALAQREFAGRLSVSIGSYQGAITRAEYQRSRGKPVVELSSYECIVQGAMAASFQTSEHVLRARACLLSLTQQEPANSTAWAMLAGVYNAQRLSGVGLPEEEATDYEKRAYLSQKIYEAGLKASELDPGDSYARFRLAHGYYAICQSELLQTEGQQGHRFKSE